jgi:ubiquinone/menaquinone biosynthesis C-methylase UbiE
MALATGYWASLTFLAANRLGLFVALAGGPATAESIAARVGTDPRATTVLLDACCGLQLVSKDAQTDPPTYRNAPAAAAFLVPGRPGYLGSAIDWSADQIEAWVGLPQTVRTGLPAVDPHRHLGQDPEETRRFVLAMHARALGIARTVVQFLDLTGARNLLDVGGGPATYAVFLAERFPDLQVSVLDLPAITAIARELIAGSAGADRVTTIDGDGTSGDFGEGLYDAVLFSGVLHQMGPETIQRMLAGARRALRPGGRVIVSDMMLDASGTQPVFSTLFSLQMVLTSKEGAVFTLDDCTAWLEDAGFSNVVSTALPPPLPYTVVSAER